MRQSGPQGGCEATVVTWEQHVSSHTVSADWQQRLASCPHRRAEVQQLVRSDLLQLAHTVKHAKTRKTAAWIVPNELWRMLFSPNNFVQEMRMELETSVLHNNVSFCINACGMFFSKSEAQMSPPWIGTAPWIKTLASPSGWSMFWIRWERVFTRICGDKVLQEQLAGMHQDIQLTEAEKKPSCTKHAWRIDCGQQKKVIAFSSKMWQMPSTAQRTLIWIRQWTEPRGCQMRLCSTNDIGRQSSAFKPKTGESISLQEVGPCKVTPMRPICSWSAVTRKLMNGRHLCRIRTRSVCRTRSTERPSMLPSLHTQMMLLSQHCARAPTNYKTKQEASMQPSTLPCNKVGLHRTRQARVVVQFHGKEIHLVFGYLGILSSGFTVSLEIFGEKFDVSSGVRAQQVER